MQRPSRRQVLAALGLSAGTTLLSGCVGSLESVGQAEQNPAPASPHARPHWTYVPLDPADVARRAYALYPEGSCMYAVFGAIITALADRVGEPFASFPIGMMRYGHSGVGGWGSLCGTANAAAAALGLFFPEEKDKKFRDGLIEELYGWYEHTQLPHYRPANADPTKEFAHSVAGSVLCHISVHRWCEASGSDAYCPERKERCRRLAADVAARTVEVLNRVTPARAARTAQHALLPDTKKCLSCHDQRELADVAARMDCRTCHTFKAPHP